MNRMARVMAAACLAVMAGCSSVPSGIDPSHHVLDSRLLGDWTSQNGTVVEVEHAGGSSFEIEVSDGKSEATYRGHLLEIAGKHFAEVSVFQPERQDDVPVYHYALVEIGGGGDTMTHRPLKASWLLEASRRMPDAVYKSTADEQAGSGGLVVRDRAAMLALLTKAAGDPGAFEAADTLKRTQRH